MKNKTGLFSGMNAPCSKFGNHGVVHELELHGELREDWKGVK